MVSSRQIDKLRETAPQEEVMRHTIPIPRAHECEHGERTGRLTSEGLPACPLCRATHRAQQETATTPDWAMLSAGDNTLTDDTPDDIGDIVAILTDNPAALARVRAMLAEMDRRDQENRHHTYQCSECDTAFTATRQAYTCSNRCRQRRSARRRKLTYTG